MARASIQTLLSLDRWAKIVGINPAHFNQAYNDIAMTVSGGCADVWYQWPWQAVDRVGREDVAEAILSAEEDIARAIGYYPAPRWQVEEIHDYPKFHRPEYAEYGMSDVRGFGKGILADFGNVIAPGQRAVSLIAAGAAVVLADADGDTVNETATVTVATALTDLREIKYYFAGHAGDSEWEIRDPRTKIKAGGNVLATFWTWQLIDPDLWEELSSDTTPGAVDFDVLANIVATVDVYREYNDTTATSATFFWEPLSTAPCDDVTACALTVQDGCLHIRDAGIGMIVPTLAIYSSGIWATAAPTVSRDPDMVKVSYWAGLINDDYKTGHTYEPLNNWWAQTIAYMAAARLERPVCACSNVQRLVEDMQTDLSFMGQSGSYAVAQDVLNNPFGTKKGEVFAWRRVKNLVPKIGKVAVL